MTTTFPPLAGIEVLQHILDGAIPVPPAVDLLGLELEEVHDGQVRFRFPTSPRFANPRNVHGGILAAVADVVASTAVLTITPADHDVVTADLHVSYLRPVAVDAGDLHPVGTVVHHGRTQANAVVELTDRHGRLLLRAAATCRLVSRGGPAHP